MNENRRLLWLMLACVLLVAASACGGGSGGGGGDNGSASGITVHEFATPDEIGTGLLDGMTLDGSAAYVEEPDPRFPEPGCEGQPNPVMFRLTLDGGGRGLVAGEDTPLHGNLMRGGSDGRVAVVSGCEGFFTELFLATESRDGRLSDVTEVTPEVPDGFLLNPSTLSWSSDGSTLLAAIQDEDAPDGDPSQVISINPESGALTRVFDAEHGTGVLKVAQLEDGTYVIATNLVVTFRDGNGVVKAGFQGKSFEVTPDSRSIVVFGRNLMLVRQGETRATELLAETPGREISAAHFSPDGEAVAITRFTLEGGQAEVGVLTVEDRKFTSIVTGAQYGRAYFSGDGRALGFNLFGAEPDFTSQVYLARFQPA